MSMKCIEKDIRKIAKSIIPDLDDKEYDVLVGQVILKIDQSCTSMNHKKYENRIVSAIIDTLDETPSIIDTVNDYLSEDNTVLSAIDEEIMNKFGIKLSEMDVTKLRERIEGEEDEEEDSPEYNLASKTYADEIDFGDRWTLRDVRDDNALQSNRGNMLNNALEGVKRHTNDFSLG